MLEHLCRYITRPAIANERLSVNRAGQVVLKLKTTYRDGTTHLVMSPLEFMQRLAALVPRPRLHLIRFHGVLAPHAKLRAAIVPIPAQTAHAGDCDHAHGASARMSWARLLGANTLQEAPRRGIFLLGSKLLSMRGIAHSARSREEWRIEYR